MKFLFETTAFSYNYPVFYKISQISETEFHAAPVEDSRKPFNLRKQNGQWTGEGNYTHNHAQQIGAQIDKSLVRV